MRHRRPRTRSHRWHEGGWAACLFSLALLLVLSGCALKEAGERDGTVRAACADDDDCPAGDVCAVELGACVSPEPSTLQLAVQLTPPATAAYATTQFADITTTSGTPVDFTLPAPRRVRGWVRTDMNPLEPNVSATVTATAAGEIPDTAYFFSAASRKKTTQDEADFGYELLLAPTGEYYQVTVLLDNEDFPPYHPVPRKFASPVEQWDLVVPGLPAYHRVTGRVVSSKAAGTPVENVRVTAFSLGTPNVSTVSGVDADGVFEVSVPPEPKGESYTLVAEAMDRADAVPTVTLVAELFVDGDVDAGDLELGPLPGRVTASVEIHGSDGAAAAGVTVRCRGGALAGTLVDEQVTDEKGQATLLLREGAFDCTCLPPVGSADGAGVWSLDTGDEDAVVWAIDLARKARLTGVVRDHSGVEPLADVAVIAVHTGTADPRHGQEVETITDAEGRYVLSLEPETYALVALPPDATLQPNRVLEHVRIDGDAVLDIGLNRATMVVGTVRGADGEPLAGVRVDFYRVPPDEAPPSESDGAYLGVAARPRARDGSPAYDQLVRVVGSALTAADGAYRVLLPLP